MARVKHVFSFFGRLLWGGRWRRVALASVALLLAAWIALNSWFIPRAMDHMTQSLGEFGLHLSYLDDPKIDLIEGRVAVSEITLYKTAQKSDPILYLSGLRIRFSLLDLISKGSFHARGRVRDGTFIIHGKDRDTEFRDLDAVIKFQPGRVQISEFSSRSNVGSQVYLTLLAQWEDAPTDPSAEESSESPSPARPAPNLAWVEKVADVMLCETRPGTPARVDLNVIIDRVNEGAVPMRLTGRIQGKELAWQKIPLQSLDASFFYENKLVSITEIQLEGQRGAAKALASYDLATSQLSIEELVSSMDPIATLGFLEADWFNPPPELEYDTPPRITSEKLRVNFRNPEANEFLLAIDAPDGIRYRDGPGEDDALTFKNFRGSIEFGNPEQLRFPNLEGTLNGIDLSGQISLLSRPAPRVRELGRSRPDDGTPPAAEPEPEPEPRSSTIAARLNRLLVVEADPDNRPQLELDIAFDPEKTAPEPPVLQIVSGKLSGSNFEWHGHAIDSAMAQFKLNEGVFEFDKIQLSGVGGQLEANGNFDTKQRILKIPKLSSSIDLADMKSDLGLELPPPLDSITFPKPPKLDMSEVEFHLDDVRASRGKFDLQSSEGLTLSEGDQTLAVERFELAMEWSEPEVLAVKRAAGRIGGLDFSVDGEWRWDGISQEGAEGASKVNPTGSPDSKAKAKAKPAAKAKPFSVIALVKEFLTFEGANDPVQLTSQFVWHSPAGPTNSPEPAKWTDQLELSAQFSGGKHRWRGYSVNESGAEFVLKDGELAFTPIRVETTDGTIESEGHYDIAQNQLRLASLQFGLDPLVALERLGVPAKGAESYIHFSTPPVFTGRDLVFDLDDWMGSFGTLKKTNQSGFTITTPKKRKVTLENAQGELTFRRGVIEANGFTAEVFRGDANLEIKIDAARKPSAYDLDFTVTNVSLASFNRWANPKKPNDDTGTFNLTFKAKGTTVPDSMQGVGRATIGSEEPMAQNFLALKGLVGALEGLFPILDGERSWELDLPFSVDGSKITTDATKLSNARTTAEISGYVDLAKDETDLVANVNLRGLLGVAGILVKPLKSDFLEFYGTGSPRDIQWESDEPPEPESEGKDEEEDEGGLRLPRLRRD